MMATALRQIVDKVVVSVSGATAGDSGPFASVDEKILMAQLNFIEIKNLEFHFDDLFAGKQSSLCDLAKKYSSIDDEVMHLVGADLLLPNDDGLCRIRQESSENEEAWRSHHFIVALRRGYPIRPTDYPPKYTLLPGFFGESGSAKIRIQKQIGNSIDSLVIPSVKTFIDTRKLYQS
jgi:nicotinic acid mononucleotide adenylyltransferase